LACFLHHVSDWNRFIIDKDMQIKQSLSPSRYTRRQVHAFLAVLVVVCILVLDTLACSYSDTSHWYETVTYHSPTPNTTVTFEAQLTATQMVGKVNKKVGIVTVTIVLDPLNQRDVTGVVTNATDLNQFLMIETFDPKGRYLPDLEIVPKTSQYRESQQTVIAQQVDIAWNWNYKLVNNLDLNSVKTDLVGSVALDQIGSSLVSSWPQGQPIHFIIPVAGKYNGAQNYDVFRTPGSATLLLLPSGSGTLSNRGSAPKLARQANPTPTPVLTTTALPGGSFVILNFSQIPDRPLSDYITFIQNLTVGNYLNLTSADLQWGGLKVNELGAAGLPKNYAPPKTVTTDLMTRLGSDQQFVNSLFYLANTQTNEPCTKPEQLNRVLRQDPPAGNLLNGLNSKVKLVVCNQVLSQSKYLTAMYQTPTPTVTLTPRPTNTASVTPAPSATITVTPSATLLPTSTNTPGPTNTSAPTSTNTTAPANTAAPTNTTVPVNTTAPTATNTSGPTSTPTITLTPTPRFTDDFVSSPNGYIPGSWSFQLAQTTTPLVAITSWPNENLYRQEIPTSNPGPGKITLSNALSCLHGQAEFKVTLYGSSQDRVTLGWEDATGANSIYVTAPEIQGGSTADSSFIQFHSVYQGQDFGYNSASSSSATPSNIYLGSSANGTPFIGRIVWEASPDNFTGSASLYLNNHTTPDAVISDDTTTGAAIIKVPTTRMKFIIRNQTGGNDSGFVQVDYVKIYSGNCQ
jgi:hypothetical protein